MKTDKTIEHARAEINLAVQVLGCPHWRWMPGMVTLNGWIVNRVDYKEDSNGLQPILNMVKVDASNDPQAVAFFDERDDVSFIYDSLIWTDRGEEPPFLPDLSHPATRGCLLQLVRSAYNEPDAVPWYDRTALERGVHGAWRMRLGPWPDMGFVNEQTALMFALVWADV
jgi:hypothetical protein